MLMALVFVAGWAVGWVALALGILGHAVVAERRKLTALEGWHGVVGPEASDGDEAA